MKKLFFPAILAFLLALSFVSAHERDFTEAKMLIDSKVSCNQLTDEQLEALGDYYMEQIHPGEQHEMMDEMMGGEGSETLKQAHINMARRIYCGENVSMSEMMMQNMPMMNGGRTTTDSTNILNTFYLIILSGVIILVYLGIIKLWKDMKKGGKK